ncbi:aromatic ring-hydroxylating dioxygenase subunit alpha [Actinoplanes sp. URMC 104]|uniref:aromatic ring-hydroxylating dioxygenase subunit alpha n=1 Tax=Actinoplanes sp. URMC 104 TaxID=3423409 RepID=UPI003F1BFBFC
MFPFPGQQPFPLNAWYAAAWDVEVARTLLPKTVCNRPMVLYRTTAGRPVALANACWHRLVPLSMGRLHGDDEIQCGYHGICFDADGRATFMPAQETINPSASVHSYPVVERHRFIWVWPGDPALADPALVPDMHWNHDPQWAGDGKTIRAACDYRLITDNLMDLTHEQFVHGSSIGQEELSESEMEVTHDERTVTVSKWMMGIEAPPFWLKNLQDKFPGYDGPVDRWQIITFEAPATVCISVGVAKAGTGAPQGDLSQGVNGMVLNTMTPETDKSCHYLWAFARNWCLGEQAITTRLREGVSGVFFEDETMLEAQQNGIDANPGYDFYNLNIDAGGMWARRLVQRMIDAEQEKGTQDAVRQAPAPTAADVTVPPHEVNPDLPGRFEQPATLLERGL